MEQSKINRINELAHKSKTQVLSAAEKAEQHSLRQEYVALVRQNLRGQLENLAVVDEDGNQTKITHKATACSCGCSEHYCH